jgi:hypothetical protein
MKRRWREVLTSWKEECVRHGRNYATIPKHCFPGLLRQLLEKDFGPSMRSGFESTGLIPFSMERALSKLPDEDREVETAVQGQLLQRLSDMRYNAPPPPMRVDRPKRRSCQLGRPTLVLLRVRTKTSLVLAGQSDSS